MCITAIANLQQESAKDGKNKTIFSKDRAIIPYIDQYWEAMTTMPRRYFTLHVYHLCYELFVKCRVCFAELPSLGTLQCNVP